MRAYRLCHLIAAALISHAAVTEPPVFPKEEQTVQDDVDHWGQAFSDQFRLFEDRFHAFETAQGGQPLDYALGVETSLRKTFPDKYRFKGAFAGDVTVHAARNESEAFQLAILPRTGIALTGVAVTASDFTNGAAILPAGAVRFWRVGFVQTPDGTQWPDPLLENTPVSIAGRDLGLLWVEIKTSAETPPGDYDGVITVRPANAAPMDLHVALHVWNFTLPDRISMPMLAWTRENAGDSFLKTAALLLEHHVDPISAGRTADLNELDRTLTFCLDRGLMYFQTPDATDSEAFAPYYRHLQEKGWLDKALLYGACDEPLARQFNEQVIPRTEQIRQSFPGLRIFLASEYYDGMERGADVHLMDLSTNFNDWLAAGRPGKQEPWWYFCGIPIGAELRSPLDDAPRMLLDRNAVEHRLVYWLAQYHHIKGLFVYAGDFWPEGNANWPQAPFKINETMRYPYAGAHYGDGFLVYPGPRPSIRLKIIRDGAEDYWYLTQLAHLAAGGNAQAKELLEGIRPAVFVDTHYFNRNPEALLGYRERLGQFLESANRP